MTKRVVITISRCLLGLSALAMHIMVCQRLVGWIGTAVIVAVQVAIAVWIVYIKYVPPIRQHHFQHSTSIFSIQHMHGPWTCNTNKQDTL